MNAKKNRIWSLKIKYYNYRNGYKERQSINLFEGII